MLRVVDLRRGGRVPDMGRSALDPVVLDGARDICDRVRAEGDAALVALTLEHDGADVSGAIQIPGPAIEEAAARVEAGLRDAVDRMADRLRALHRRQVPEGWEEHDQGIAWGEVVRPLDSAGCYVPGGRAAYPSTVLMTAIPARVAGVRRVVMCTPPNRNGSVADAVLYAAGVAGIDAVYRVGGAHAIAALAYGTESIPSVDKIVGPGNVWVTAAKRHVSDRVGIDALAGPTELVLVADATADPAVVAVDLVAQAEHDPLARTTLVTWDPEAADAAARALAGEVERSPRHQIVRAALEHAVAVLVADEEHAASVVDGIAPEHLQIVTADPRGFLKRVRSFGAAFLGPATPVSFGDYGVGSNHVLPTMSTARHASGLRAADFVTVSSVVEAAPEALERVGPDVEAIATAEGLPAHARAVAVRRGPAGPGAAT